MRPLPRLATVLLLSALAACDAAPGERPPTTATLDGLSVRAESVAPLQDGAVLAGRPGGVVTAVGPSEGALDVYFEVEMGSPDGALVLDLLDRPGGTPGVRLVQTRTGPDRYAIALDGTGWSGGADVEFVGDGGVVHSSTDAPGDSLGTSDEVVESVHYEVGEDGEVIVVYDFSDGPPAAVTPTGDDAPVPCVEIRVRPRDRSWRLERPTAALSGTGWTAVRFETAEVRRAQ